MDDLGLHRASGAEIAAADLYAILRLRAEVFVIEQECVYLDPDGRDLEPGTIHLWRTAPDGTVATYVRLLSEPSGGHRIGRVLTHARHRGQGLAGRLIQQALSFAHAPVTLDAQSHLVPVYSRLGFEVIGDEYVEDGILHTPMRLRSRP